MNLNNIVGYIYVAHVTVVLLLIVMQYGEKQLR